MLSKWQLFHLPYVIQSSTAFWNELLTAFRDPDTHFLNLHSNLSKVLKKTHIPREQVFGFMLNFVLNALI
jgi:hypothetical protein